MYKCIENESNFFSVIKSDFLRLLETVCNKKGVTLSFFYLYDFMLIVYDFLAMFYILYLAYN